MNASPSCDFNVEHLYDITVKYNAFLTTGVGGVHTRKMVLNLLKAVKVGRDVGVMADILMASFSVHTKLHS